MEWIRQCRYGITVLLRGGARPICQPISESNRRNIMAIFLFIITESYFFGEWKAAAMISKMISRRLNCYCPEDKNTWNACCALDVQYNMRSTIATLFRFRFRSKLEQFDRLLKLVTKKGLIIYMTIIIVTNACVRIMFVPPRRKEVYMTNRTPDERRQVSVFLLTVLQSILNQQQEMRLLDKAVADHIYLTVKDQAIRQGWIE